MPKDLFSTQAGVYARYRPTYPKALFEYLASLVTRRRAAWDCATGNGQAALALTPYFERIDASDLSAKQIEQAVAHPKIEYWVSPAEHTPFPDHRFDLITVAQAYHWLDFAAFAAEVRRVARPEGIVAIWCYGLANCEDLKVEALVREFYRDKVGSYWDKERKYVEDGYATVAFPYRELPARSFSMSLSWSREDLLGYLGTWSSVQHYIKDRGSDPVAEFAASLQAAWPGEAAKRFDFPLSLRVGRVE
ncbi:MAG TPA: class I SAM-dependent methyltransferase [bacterium]|nr:class I SAM-dependent methyltransferase [bacterium]